MAYERSGTNAAAFVFSVIGTCAGLIVGTFFSRPEHQVLRVYERENKPAVLREWGVGVDFLYVQTKPGEFVTLDDYLSGIPDEGQREQEEVDIKIAAEWYKK